MRIAHSELQAKRAALLSSAASRPRVGFLERVFQGFKQACELLRTARSARQASKQARALRLQAIIMQEAEAASRQGDLRQLYKIIRTLAPKNQHLRVQIHDESGKLLGPAAEMQELVGHYTKLFAPSGRAQPITVPGHATAFTEDEISSKLRQVRCGISSAAGVRAFGVLESGGRYCSAGTHAYCQCKSLRITHHSPYNLWADCWLSLIPKPHKSTRRPGDLRPLGIQEISGKALASVIKDRLFLEIGDIVLRYPQFAYISGRGTEAAVARVSEHCRTVRSFAGHRRASIH